MAVLSVFMVMMLFGVVDRVNVDGVGVYFGVVVVVTVGVVAVVVGGCHVDITICGTVAVLLFLVVPSLAVVLLLCVVMILFCLLTAL